MWKLVTMNQRHERCHIFSDFMILTCISRFVRGGNNKIVLFKVLLYSLPGMATIES